MKYLSLLLLILLCRVTFPLPRHDTPRYCNAITAAPINVLNADGEIVDVLLPGTHTTVTGLVREEYARIDENGLTGFVHYPSGLIINTACFLDLERLSDSELPPIDASLHAP